MTYMPKSAVPVNRYMPKSAVPIKTVNESGMGQFAAGAAQGVQGILPLEQVAKYGPQELKPVAGILGMAQKKIAPIRESFEAVEEYPKPKTMGGSLARLGGQVSPLVAGMASPVLRGEAALTGRTLLTPKVSDPQKAVNLSKEVLGELNTARSAFGEGISSVIEQFPDEMIDLKSTTELLRRLPKIVLKGVKDTSKYQVKWMKGGTPQPTLKNLQNLKEAVGDYLSEGEWIKTPLDKKNIREVYRGIKDVMVKSKPELKPQLDAYHEFITRVYSPLSSKLTRKGESVVSPMLRTMTSAGEEADRAALEAFKQISPAVKKPLGALSRYGKIKEIKKIPSRIPFVGGVFK